jgi:hypothetical protein
MAHGLGWYLAQEEMQARQAELNAEGTVVCPLCGEALEHNGVAWFCYSDPDTEKCPQLPALESAFRSRATEEERRRGHHIDAFQGQLVGAVVAQGKIAVKLETTRGGGGLTNLRVSAGDGVQEGDVPALARGQWVFMGWTPL